MRFTMKFGIAYINLSKKFEEHGRRIVEYTSWFLIIPILFSLFFATGFQKLRLNSGESTFVPTEGTIGTYQSRLLKLFPMDISFEFESGRALKLYNYGSVIVQAIDKGSVLRESIFQQIILLDQVIRNFTIHDYDEFNYESLCARYNGKCLQNKILLLKNKIKEIENRTFLLEYPTGEVSKKYDILSLGGVQMDQNGYIVSARTLRLIYFLDSKEEWKKTIAEKWEKAFINQIQKLDFANLDVAKDISTSMKEINESIFPESAKLIPYSMIVMFLFTILTCLTPDLLRSKPWTGIMSATATGMSIASGFGLIAYIGNDILPNASMIPFLVLGIGMDDTFVMLSAWKKTDTQKCLKERMAQTFHETGVSITLTSLTNIASFAVGIIFTSWPIHRQFCILMVICLTFDYIYQITFVGAVLALCGRAEERRLHSMFFVPLDKFSITDNKNFLQHLLCYVKSDKTTEKNSKKTENLITGFWTNMGNLMTKKLVKALVIFFYFIYLGIAIWGFTKFSYRATLDTSLVRGSYRLKYYNMFKENYHQYQYRLQLFILQELDYADPQIQQKVKNMIQELEADPLIAGSLLTESWLKRYLEFLSDRRIVLFLTGFNLTKSEDFIYVLRNVFLQHPWAKRFRQDVAFNQNYTKIVSSRFLFQTNITMDANHFYNQLTNFKKKLAAAPFSAIVYHPLFFFFDIVDSIPSTAIQTFSAVIASVFFISVLLLPNITCIISVLFTIISVAFGVMGFMFLWDVKLSIASITVFIIVIGFSVDYAAHVSCAYVSSNDVIPNNRLVKAIDMTAMPILQGSISTILAIIFALNAPLLDFTVGVKVVVSACIIAALHGIIFVPVIMTLVDSVR